MLQIEREKADLSVQVIQLSERLEEAEGGAESQVNNQAPLHIFLFTVQQLTKKYYKHHWSCNEERRNLRKIRVSPIFVEK